MTLRDALAAAEVLITDPGRGNSAPCTRALERQGFAVSKQCSRFGPNEAAPFRGRLLSYRRGNVMVDGVPRVH